MVRAAHDKNWSQTPLGPISGWPENLRNSVSTCLNSLFPVLVRCRPELVYICNDAAISIFGDKHPRTLGQRAADVRSEVWWSTIGPMPNRISATGSAARQSRADVAGIHFEAVSGSMGKGMQVTLTPAVPA